MKPPSICPRSIDRRDRVADVLQDVDAQQPVGAGEAVHLHLGHRGAVREVVERVALAGRGIEVDVRACGRSPARRAARAAGTPPRTASANGIDRAAAARVSPSTMRTSRRVAAEERGRHGRQPRRDLRARVHDRRAVQVACPTRPPSPTCSAPCRCASASGGSRSSATPSAVGGDLPDLGEQALPHLRAAVVHLHGAVAIDEHERARLVEEAWP